jgi:hypothetical protein
VDGKDQEPGAETAMIRFQPELLWDLLDPSISRASLGPNASISTEGTSPSASLHVTTTFVHPVAVPNAQTQEPLESNALDYSSQRLFEGFDSPFLDDFLSDSFLSGLLQQ